MYIGDIGTHGATEDDGHRVLRFIGADTIVGMHQTNDAERGIN
jgi:hypothetical protein